MVHITRNELYLCFGSSISFQYPFRCSSKCWFWPIWFGIKLFLRLHSPIVIAQLIQLSWENQLVGFHFCEVSWVWESGSMKIVPFHWQSLFARTAFQVRLVPWLVVLEEVENSSSKIFCGLSSYHLSFYLCSFGFPYEIVFFNRCLYSGNYAMYICLLTTRGPSKSWWLTSQIWVAGVREM